jgi:uncharacterized repeat protein (TIGR01451 family)
MKTGEMKVVHIYDLIIRKGKMLLLMAGWFSLVLLLLLLNTPVNAAPIQRAITISTSSATDATFSDWTTADNLTTPTVAGDWGTATDVTNNSGQFTTDNQYQSPCTATPADLDCSASAAGVGRDLRKFSYTWDSTNLYMYVERYSSSTSANDWWFYIDSDDDGLMETGETILNVAWTGANGKTVRQLWTYNSSRAGGDPLTCPATGTNSVADGYCPVAGEGDGYDMPGTISAGASLGTVYGGAEGGSGVDASGNPLSGVSMETFIAWGGASGLGLSGPTSVGFHISSSNGTNLPTQLDDNMNGLGATGGIAFSDTTLAKSVNTPSIIGGRQFTYTLTVTNNGPSDATNIEVTDIFLANVTYNSDDSASTGTTTTVVGSTLTWDIPSLLNGASVSLVITMDSAVVAGITTVSNTADITDQDQADTDATNNSASVNIDLLPAPSLTMLKTVQTFSDPVNASNPKAIPGAFMDYTIIATNSGAGVVDTDTTVMTDPVPVNTDLFVGDLGGAGSGPVSFADGATSSTLTYTYTSLDSAADDVDFSNDNGATWVYYQDSDFSNIDADGFDATVTNIRVNPKGTFAGAAGSNPSISLTFRVRVQ